jgi:alpha-aminoadipate carrier protein LysW
VIVVPCIDCRQPIKLISWPVEGEFIICPNCGAELEVIGVEPIELDWAYLAPVNGEGSSAWYRDVEAQRTNSLSSDE